MQMEDVILQVENLKAWFKSTKRTVKAVDGISFTVHKGERIGIVGESGSGKSITCLSILNLKKHPDEVLEGRIIFQGQDLLAMDEKELNAIRGKEIAIIFQDPKTSLNPFFKISTVMVDNIRRHQKSSRKEARAKAVEMLRLVNFPDPEKRIDDYPAMLSGGMKQRVQIAMALSHDVKLLIADEATTALDATIQAQVINLLDDITRERGMALIIVTHDLGIAARLCDRVDVMYSGHIIESATTEELFSRPMHPYTKSLIRNARRMDLTDDGSTIGKYDYTPSSGCPFSTRCPEAEKRCRKEPPEAMVMGGGHMVSCWLYDEREE